MSLRDFFASKQKAALGFSGGVDSSYLLYAGLSYGADIGAYYIKTAFQPEFEFDDACRFAGQLRAIAASRANWANWAKMTVIEVDILSHKAIADNPPNRCYHCKRLLFETLIRHAAEDGYLIVMDGSNASDSADDRPGMAALSELGVYSPLRECGIAKEEVRRLSREAGLFTWNKPAYACLATRIPAGMPITASLLEKVERAEDGMRDLGFTDFRVRVMGGAANEADTANTVKIQLPGDQMERAMKERSGIISAVKPYFDTVLLDLDNRRRSL